MRRRGLPVGSWLYKLGIEGYLMATSVTGYGTKEEYGASFAAMINLEPIMDGLFVTARCCSPGMSSY